MQELDFTTLDKQMRKAIEADRRYLDALRESIAKADELKSQSMQALKDSISLLHREHVDF